MSDQTNGDYKEIARQSRLKILEMVHRAKTSHIASNFSVADIATVLYANLKEGDEVVWSKGWAAAAHYYFLSRQGVIPESALDEFPNKPYLGLAETTVPGVLVNGGSVGHGLPIAAGIAYAKKLSGKPGRVYCIMSDGELNEGTTWESAELANHLNLRNLTAIIDVNKWQAMGRTKDVLNMEPIQQRWTGHGWSTFRLDGHKHDDLALVLNAYDVSGPIAIICDTVKGKGVSFFEDHLLYHYKHVDDQEYERAKAELNA